MQDLFILITQADGSKWAVSMEALERLFIDEFFQEHDYLPTYGVSYNRQDVVIFAETLKWSAVYMFAVLVEAAPPEGPDLNWGWQHGDKTVINAADIPYPPVPTDDTAELLPVAVL